MKNYYKIMYMSRQSFTKEKLEARYKAFREMLEQNYEMYKDNPKELEKLVEIEKDFVEAYNVLSNDEERKEYDALLDEEQQKRNEQIQREQKEKEERDKKEKEAQEKYSCFKMYDSSLIKSVKYTRNSKREIFFSPYTFEEGKYMRKVSCRLLGFISYNTDYKEEQYRLARYEVKTISTQNPETLKYTVITPVINYDKVCENPEYKDALYKKLFSEKNLEKSKHENYEYLGRLIHGDEGYEVDYDKEEFCASVRFGTKLKRKVDNPTKPKIGLKRKFKKIIRKVLEKNKQEDYER